jgi:hypothetical protein
VSRSEPALAVLASLAVVLAANGRSAASTFPGFTVEGGEGKFVESD